MITIDWGDPAVCSLVQGFLNQIHVVLVDMDTIPGFLSPCNEEGKKALDRIKGRLQKPYLVVANSRDQAGQWIDFSKIPQASCVKALMESCWPGPLTLLLPASSHTPKAAQHEGVIAIRVPDHQPLRSLLSKTGFLFSTSANRAGEQTPRTLDEVNEALYKHVACVVRNAHPVGGVGMSDRDNTASTIVDCTGSMLRIVREGAYDIVRLKALTGSACWQP